MKKRFATITISFVAAVCIVNGNLLLPFTSFLMTGAIPGTTITVPFWAMMAVYCLGITAIVTHYIEEIFAFLKANRAATAKKQRLPKRRYSNI